MENIGLLTNLGAISSSLADTPSCLAVFQGFSRGIGICFLTHSDSG